MRCSSCKEYIPEIQGITECPSCRTAIAAMAPEKPAVSQAQESGAAPAKPLTARASSPSRQSKEAVVLQSEEEKKKKRGLFLPGLLLVVLGAFCNGLMIRYEVDGILGSLLRELLRLTILVGFLLMVISFFRHFWKPLLVIFILLVTALAGWNIFNETKRGEASVSKEAQGSFEYENAKFAVLADKITQEIQDRYGWYVDVTMTKDFKTDGIEVEKNVILDFYFPKDTYDSLVREGGGNPNRAPEMKNYIQKTTAVIRENYAAAPKQYGVRVKEKPSNFVELMEQKAKRIEQHKNFIKKGTMFTTEESDFIVSAGKIVSEDPKKKAEGEKILKEINESLSALPKGALDPYLNDKNSDRDLKLLESMDDSERDWGRIVVGAPASVVAEGLGNPDYIRFKQAADGTEVSTLFFGRRYVTVHRGVVTANGSIDELLQKA